MVSFRSVFQQSYLCIAVLYAGMHIRHPLGLSRLLQMWVVGYDFIFRCKVKFTLEQAMKAQIALDGGVWSMPGPGCLTPGRETRYPLYWRMDGPQGQCGRVRKISPPAGFDPRTVQPVASLYTDYTIPAHTFLGAF
jgi:hypothetical protein